MTTSPWTFQYMEHLRRLLVKMRLYGIRTCFQRYRKQLEGGVGRAHNFGLPAAYDYRCIVVGEYDGHLIFRCILRCLDRIGVPRSKHEARILVARRCRVRGTPLWSDSDRGASVRG
jgi:hypothetical protein